MCSRGWAFRLFQVFWRWQIVLLGHYCAYLLVHIFMWYTVRISEILGMLMFSCSRCCSIPLQRLNLYTFSSISELLLSTFHAQQYWFSPFKFNHTAVCAWSGISAWFLLCMSVHSNEIEWFFFMCIGHFVHFFLWSVCSSFSDTFIVLSTTLLCIHNLYILLYVSQMSSPILWCLNFH